MKKKRIILGALGAVLVIGAMCAPGILREIQERQALAEHYQKIAGFEENAARIEDALTEQGWDMDETRQEKIVPTTWGDQEGHSITYYVYTFKNMEYGEKSPALHEIFDPSTADSSAACRVNDVDAVLYQKDGHAYLWWSPADGCILLIEYEPTAVSDAEIMKMAESVPAISTDS